MTDVMKKFLTPRDFGGHPTPGTDNHEALFNFFGVVFSSGGVGILDGMYEISKPLELDTYASGYLIDTIDSGGIRQTAEGQPIFRLTMRPGGNGSRGMIQHAILTHTCPTGPVEYVAPPEHEPKTIHIRPHVTGMEPNVIPQAVPEKNPTELHRFAISDCNRRTGQTSEKITIRYTVGMNENFSYQIDQEVFGGEDRITPISRHENIHGAMDEKAYKNWLSQTLTAMCYRHANDADKIWLTE